MATLTIDDLHVSIDGKAILKGVNLVIQEGEIHALMGPNGNGKSTLLMSIMGHPKYTITQGTIFLDDVNILELDVNERSLAGLFLGMQYPQEVSGVTNSDFLKSAMNVRRENPIGLFEFVSNLQNNIDRLRMKEDLAHRYLNEGFSGGEKKRNEILQMLMLEPTFSMLDEIDSGLDIDALKIVASVLKEAQIERQMGMLVVSHYERFFEFIVPTHTHIMIDGKIVMDGDVSLVKRIDLEGYDWIEGYMPQEQAARLRLDSCAVKSYVEEN